MGQKHHFIFHKDGNVIPILNPSSHNQTFLPSLFYDTKIALTSSKTKVTNDILENILRATSFIFFLLNTTEL